MLCKVFQKKIVYIPLRSLLAAMAHFFPPDADPEIILLREDLLIPESIRLCLKLCSLHFSTPRAYEQCCVSRFATGLWNTIFSSSKNLQMSHYRSTGLLSCLILLCRTVSWTQRNHWCEEICGVFSPQKVLFQSCPKGYNYRAPMFFVYHWLLDTRPVGVIKHSWSKNRTEIY